MYFMEDNLLHAMSKLGYVQLRVATKVFYIIIPSNIVHTAKIEIRECIKWSFTRG